MISPPPRGRRLSSILRGLSMMVLLCTSQMLIAQYTWVGNSTDWYDTGNYAPVPGSIAALSGNTVTIPAIPAGGNFPSTQSGSPITMSRLTLQAGATATIPIGLQIIADAGGGTFGIWVLEGANLIVNGEADIMNADNGLANYGGTVVINGVVLIDDVSDHGIYNNPFTASQASVFTNYGEISIGTSGPGGNYGIRNNGNANFPAEFTNRGMITLQNPGTAAILNINGTTGTFFENFGDLSIFASGNTGIRNINEATFQNLSPGLITIDHALRGIWQSNDAVFFNDNATIRINDNFPTTNVDFGIRNESASSLTNRNNGLIEISDVIRSGISNANARIENQQARIAINRSQENGIITTTAAPMTTFVNTLGGILELCQTGQTGFAAIRNAGQSGFWNGDLMGNVGIIRIEGGGQDGIQNEWMFTNQPGGSSILIGQGSIPGCPASIVTRYGIHNLAGANFFNNDLGSIAIANTQNDGIRNAGSFFNQNLGGGAATIAINHGNAMSSGVHNTAAANFTQDNNSSLSISGTALYGFRNQSGQVTNTLNATATITAGIVSGFYNDGSLNNDNGASLTIANPGQTALDNRGQILNESDALIALSAATNFGLWNHNGASFQNGSAMSSATLTVYNTGNPAIFNENVGSIIDNLNCSVIETNGQVQNDAPFNNEAILKTTFVGLNTGTVPVNNTGIIIDVNNAFDSNLTTRVANPAAVDNAVGIIAAPVYACAVVNAADPVIIPQPIISNGAVNLKTFQTNPNWFDDQPLTQDAGDYNAGTNVFTYDPLFNPPNGGTDILYFNVGGGCTYTGEIHINVDALPEIQLVVDKKNFNGTPMGAPVVVENNLNEPYAITICSGEGIQLDVNNLGPLNGNAPGNPPLYIEVVFTDPNNIFGGSTSFTFPGSSLPLINLMGFPIVNNTGMPVNLTGTLTPYWESDGIPADFNPATECAGGMLSVVVTVLPDPADLIDLSGNEMNRRICSGDDFSLDIQVDALPAGVASLYFEWEISVIGGPSGGPAPYVNGQVAVETTNCGFHDEGAIGQSPSFTGMMPGILAFNGEDVLNPCSAPTLTLSNASNQFRRVEYTLRPVLVTNSGEVCPSATTIPYNVYIYPRPQLELDNLAAPVDNNAMNTGDPVVICNETSPNGLIRVRQWPTMVDESAGEMGDLEYDWTVSLPAGVTAAGPLASINIGSDGPGVSKTDFVSPLAGLPTLTNNTVMPLDVTIQVTPYYDPVNPNAAGLPGNLDPDGRCAGTTQSIVVTVLPTPDLEPSLFADIMQRVVEDSICGSDGLLPAPFSFLMDAVNTNMAPYQVEFELYAVDMSGAPNVTRSTTQTLIPNGGHPNSTDNGNGHEVIDGANFTEFLMNNGPFTETVIYTFRPQIDFGQGLETEFCFGEFFTIEVMVYPIPTASVGPAMPSYVCENQEIDVIGVPGGYPPVPGPGTHLWEVTSPQPLGFTGTGDFIDAQALPGGQATTSQTGRFRGETPGTIRLQYLWTDGNGCTIREPIILDIDILVAPDINPITGSNMVCPQAMETYAVSQDNSPANSYVWTLSSGGIITSSNTGPSVDIAWNATLGGPHQLTVVETGPNGCDTINHLYVQIVDMNNPMVMCPADLTVSTQDDGSYNCNYTVQDKNLDIHPSDNCGILSYTHDYMWGGTSLKGQVFPLGDTEVIWTVTDISNNEMTCSFTITVVDDQAPMLTCPPNVTVNSDGTGLNVLAIVAGGTVDGSPVTGIELNTYGPVVSDNCTNFTLSWVSPTAQPGAGNGNLDQILFTTGVPPANLHTVTYTASDDAGNETTCSFTVAVIDNEAPEITCPADLYAVADINTCSYEVLNNALDAQVIFDNSLPTSASNSFDGNASLMGAIIPVGPHTIIWTVSDAVGNENTCSFEVFIEDLQAPTVLDCPADFTISADPGVCEAVVNYFHPIFLDNCLGLQNGNLDLGFPSGSVFPLGTTNVSWSYTDPTNNGPAVCAFTVTVEDDEDPMMTCPPNVTVDADGKNLNPAAFIYGIAVDDADMDCAVILNGIEPILSDNCPNPTLTWEIDHVNLGMSSGNGSVTGVQMFGLVQTVTYTVTDGAGNTEECSFMVTVKDVEAPIITVCAENKELFTADGPGNCSIVLPDYTSEVEATDLCLVPYNGTLTITQQPAANTLLQGAQAHVVTFTVEDVEGNSSTCSINVTLTDNVNPVARCVAPFTIQLNGNSYNLTVDEVNDGSSDDCGLVSLVLEPMAFSCAQAGTTVDVTLTVADAAGNEDQCTTMVTVEDDQAPIIVKCPDPIMVGNDVDRCGAYVNWSPLHKSDNCDPNPAMYYWLTGATIAGGNDIDDLFGLGDGDTDNDPIPGTPSGQIFEVGVTVVNFILVDASGNVSAVCSFTVTVNDTQLPVLETCPEDRTISTEPDVCFGLVPDITAEMIANDNCPLEFTQDPVANAQFGAAHGDEQIVVVTATDKGGNTVVCMVQLTLIDTQAPEILDCPADRDIVAEPGLCEGIVPDLLGELTAMDNCVIDTMIQYPAFGSPNFGAAHGDTIQVKMIVIDEADNRDTCTVILTLIDEEKPSIMACPLDVTVNPNTGCQHALANYLDSIEVNDNCMIEFMTQSPPAGFLFGNKQGGEQEVTLTITDEAGNDSICIFTVTVNPTPTPVVSIPESSYCLNETFQVVQASSSTPGGTFFWYQNAGLSIPVNPTQISGANNQFYTPKNEIGTQTVFVVAVYPNNTCTSDPATVTTVIYGCELEVTDPCACKNNATTLTNGQFDEIILLNGPAGQTWSITAVSGLFRAISPAPPAQPLAFVPGMTMTQISPGVYRLIGVHVDALGYSLTVSNGMVSQSISNTCYYPNPEISGVFDNYCINYGIVHPVGTATYPGNPPFPAPQESARFDLFNSGGVLVGNNITQFNPAALGPDVYQLRYTFNAVDDVPSASYPGCTQVVTKTIQIFGNPPMGMNCNNKANVSLGVDGTATITADDILEGSYGCYDQYQVMIVGKTFNIVDCGDVGKTFEVKVIDPITGNSCWGKITVEDKMPPTLICADVTVSCNEDALDPNSIGYPIVSDNCGIDNVTLVHSSMPEGQGCNSAFDEIINRHWTATDKNNGMSVNCIQRIYFRKGTLAEVTFPQNWDDKTLPSLNCATADTTPDFTGYPQIGNLPVGGFCKMSYSYMDKVLPVCENSYKIIRSWMVMDNCTSGMISGDQIIIVSDKVGPVFSCPAPDQVKVTNPAWNGCGATIFVPTINIADGCTLPPDIQVTTSVMAGGQLLQLPTNGGFFNVPYGVHIITYRAVDLCGNQSTCSLEILVEDTAPPTAVCNDQIVVSLIDDITYVFAETFDDGSHDNCSPKVNFLVRRMDNPNCFGNDATELAPTVPFYCCDAQVGTVGIVLRVFVDKNHNGLHDSNEPFNECMVNVSVQDKIAPVIQCPADMTITCLEDIAPQEPSTLVRKINPGTFISPDYAFTYIDSVIVSGLPNDATIMDLNVLLNIDHAMVDQLRIKLKSPSGTEMVLFNGGNCGLGKKDIQVVFDDQGATFKCDGFPKAITGTLKPQGTILSVVNGQSPNGTWIFEITDKAPLGAGTIQELGLEITHGTPLAVKPTAFDNAEICGLQFTHIDLDTKAQCANGQTLERQWTVTDAAGNSSSCIQRITLEDTTPLIVDFPEDITLTDCTKMTNPTFAGEPVHNGDCELVAISMVDEVFDVVPGACFKVVRTWTVVDWCKYDPTKPSTNGGIVLDAFQNIIQDDGDGYFKFVQTIKVIDNDAPILTCPSDTILLSTSSDCSAHQANLGIVAVDACTPGNQLKSTWTIDLNNDGNVDLNGTGLSFDQIVPLGTHRARFHVTDGCGNFSVCSFLFTVVDAKKPTPICITGLSVDLMPTTGEVMVPASAFESGDSHDNCTPHNQLQFRIERFVDIVAGQTEPGPNSDTTLIFDCDDYEAGILVFVGLWVGDQAGNWDLCITYIDVQNNMGAPCDTTGNLNGSIYGEITTEWLNEVEDVEISLMGYTNKTMSTSIGTFNFPAIKKGNTYEIMPEKEDAALNGVSTYDLLLIQKHLLGVKPLASPYCIIAADANNSGNVTISDIISIRKTLLTASPTFLNNSSWRFVDQNYIFADPKNPWKNGIPESVTIDPLSGNHKVDFVGIKIGDVSGDAKTTSLYGAETRSKNGLTAIWTPEKALEAGDRITVPFTLEEGRNPEGFQFTLSFDPALEFMGIESANLSDENIGYRFIEDGLIAVSWHGEWNGNMDLFSLNFNVKSSGLLSQMLAIHSTIVTAEVYYKEGYDHRFEDMEMRFQNNADVNDGLALYQNIPNPFTGHTMIGFNLPEAGQAVLIFHDVSGREVKRIIGNYDAGFHQIELLASDLPGAGMYYYTLQFNGRQLTRKMSLLK